MEGFLDISLDITRASSLTKALARHTMVEYLDQENKYKCPKQGRLVRAVKRITIERAPNVLVFQLKRFEYSMYGSKIAKKVSKPSFCINLARIACCVGWQLQNSSKGIAGHSLIQLPHASMQCEGE